MKKTFWGFILIFILFACKQNEDQAFNPAISIYEVLNLVKEKKQVTFKSSIQLEYLNREKDLRLSVGDVLADVEKIWLDERQTWLTELEDSLLSLQRQLKELTIELMEQEEWSREYDEKISRLDSLEYIELLKQSSPHGPGYDALRSEFGGKLAGHRINRNEDQQDKIMITMEELTALANKEFLNLVKVTTMITG